MRKLTLLLFAVLTLFGCQKTNNDLLVGEWELTEHWGTFNDGTRFVDCQCSWNTIEFKSNGYVFYDNLVRTEYERREGEVIIFTTFQGILYEDHYLIETLTDRELQLHFVDTESMMFDDNTPYHFYYRCKRK